MRINGVDALQYQPPPDPRAKGKRKKPPRATYSRRFQEIEAYTAMGMDIRDYEALPGIPYWAEDGELCKCDVLTWHEYHLCLENLRTGIF